MRCRFSALDDAAAHLGLDLGLPLGHAPTPSVRNCKSSMPMKPADARALNAIAAWCDRFTPLVALDSPAWPVSRPFTGCVHLFGGEAAMIRRVCRRPDRARLYRQQRRHRPARPCARGR